MTKFSKKIKIYLLKNTQTVDISILVNEELTNGYKLLVEDFENILDHWKPGVGIDRDGTHWYVQYKERGPRPHRAPNPYVRISITINGMTFHHRVTEQEMRNLKKEYEYQKMNKMYWDE
tara:strand:- start:20827 stop:21183 length:357 start_codon:yes stop_codon:yes gene_type:complete